MLKFRELLLKKRNERGDSELPVTLIMLPLVIFLIFALIDISFYMNTRSQVQSILTQGTRQMALYGGNSRALPLNKTGASVADDIYGTLYQNGQCTKSFCDAPPVVTCTPDVASRVGQKMTCTLIYDYHPFVRDLLFGFSAGITDPAFTISSTTVSEVGQ